MLDVLAMIRVILNVPMWLSNDNTNAAAIVAWVMSVCNVLTLDENAIRNWLYSRRFKTIEFAVKWAFENSEIEMEYSRHESSRIVSGTTIDWNWQHNETTRSILRKNLVFFSRSHTSTHTNRVRAILHLFFAADCLQQCYDFKVKLLLCTINDDRVASAATMMIIFFLLLLLCASRVSFYMKNSPLSNIHVDTNLGIVFFCVYVFLPVCSVHFSWVLDIVFFVIFVKIFVRFSCKCSFWFSGSLY